MDAMLLSSQMCYCYLLCETAVLVSLHRLGARVMRDQDGRPVSRDVTFLTEKNIIPKARADRIMTAGSLTMTAATRTARLPDPEVPITLYTEAAAKNPNCGNFYVRPIL